MTEYSYHNVILIVAFNFADCVNNKQLIKTLYQNHFKQIIFYSDLPTSSDTIQDSEINYLSMFRGQRVHIIFNHFYQNYSQLLQESDGFFYTMDDNIININILNLYSNKKIIYYTTPLQSENIKPIDQWSGWYWDTPSCGKNAVINLLNDERIKKYNFPTEFSHEFSDFFYLPKKYCTPVLFDLFDIFSQYCVFLEIAIPNIIRFIEPNIEMYHNFTGEVLWYDREKFNNKEYVYNSINKEFNLILHPLKFNLNPNYANWLLEFFGKTKCVIITTINKPTETILKHINNKEYDVIIVGDNKTPNDYKNLDCIFLDVMAQKKLFPHLSNLIPYNHYCRKNLGYLFAIKKGYSIIYETDDDNIPYDNFDSILSTNDFSNTKIIQEYENKWINIFKHFTNNNHIWPRGYPLALIKQQSSTLSLSDNTQNIKPAIITGLVENDPDVDALFRLICIHDKDIVWKNNETVIVSNKNICVFNTQNTFWLNKNLFVNMLIPSSVSFRYCDILRGIITNIILNITNNHLMYISPNVIQIRNEHNLMSDFISEYEMYFHNHKILNFINSGIDNDSLSIKKYIQQIYQNLLNNNVIKQTDIDILNIWFTYFE